MESIKLDFCLFILFMCCSFSVKSRSLSERTESVTSDPGVTKANQEECKTDETIDMHRVPDRELSENQSKDGDAQPVEQIGKRKNDLTKAEEHQSAVNFTEQLLKELPYLLKLASRTDIDEAMQKFSSEFSSSKCFKWKDMTKTD